jgi:hypothetical protein
MGGLGITLGSGGLGLGLGIACLVQNVANYNQAIQDCTSAFNGCSD